MQTFETAHHDPIDDVNARLEGLNIPGLQTEKVADQAAEDLTKFPYDLAITARADLQGARTDTLQQVSTQRETTQESVQEVKAQNLDRELVLSINEKFADVPLEERKLFELAIMQESQDNPEYQDKLIDLLSQPDFIFDEGEGPSDYIKKSWIPTVSTISYFNKKFDLSNTAKKVQDTAERVDTAEEKADTNEEKADTNEEKMDIKTEKLKSFAINSENLRQSLSSLPDSWVANFINSRLDEVASIMNPSDTINDFKLDDKLAKIEQINTEITESLWSWEGSKLWELLDTAEKGSSEYQALTSSLRDFDPSFDAKIKEYELPLPLAPRDGIEDSNDGSLDIRTYVSRWDGSITKLDTSIYPPKRTVSLSDSKYQLETDTPMTKDIQTISTDFELKAKEIGSRINSLSKLINVIEKIWQSKLLKIEDIKETLIKHVLRRTWMANNPDLVDTINSANSMDDLKTNILFKLVALKDESQRLLKNEQKEYRKRLAEQYDNYQDMLTEIDEKTKEVLSFLKSIWFDLIPQSITDLITRQLNENPSLRWKLWMDSEIDLPNGKLGFDKNPWGGKKLDELDKKAFAMFFNKMIGIKDADWNDPINVDSIGTTGSPIPDKVKFQTLLNKSWILDIWWVETAISNVLKDHEEDVKAPKPVAAENSDQNIS